MMEITGKWIDSDAKRVYWPLVITVKCPDCGDDIKVENPDVGPVTRIEESDDTVYFCCDCGGEFYVKLHVKLEITMTDEKIYRQ